jgi:uncharacterized membrane protein (TIGR02234 family)
VGDGPVGNSPARGGRSDGRSLAREYALVLGLAAAGAGVVFLAVHQVWARVVTPAAAPLPAGSVPVTGQGLVPAAGALAVVSLAGLAAVIATRGLARRLVGVLLAVAGGLTAVVVIARVSTAAVLAAAHATAVPQAGSATAGGGAAGPGAGAVPGGPPGVAAAHVVMAGLPWRPLAAAGALAVLAAGVLVAWRGPRWPAMSTRYERAGAGKPEPVADTATLWESLSRGVDPTERPGQTGSR